MKKSVSLLMALFLLFGTALTLFAKPAGAVQTSPRTLKLTSPYMRGDDVEFAQVLLGVNADGIYGPVTASRVKEFQASAGLKVDGIVGKETWNALLKTNGLRTLKLTTPYMKGNDVALVQDILHIKVDGIYGPETASAVKRVQSSNGWPADGIVGLDTWYLLYLIAKYD